MPSTSASPSSAGPPEPVSGSSRMRAPGTRPSDQPSRCARSGSSVSSTSMTATSSGSGRSKNVTSSSPQPASRRNAAVAPKRTGGHRSGSRIRGIRRRAILGIVRKECPFDFPGGKGILPRRRDSIPAATSYRAPRDLDLTIPNHRPHSAAWLGVRCAGAGGSAVVRRAHGASACAGAGRRRVGLRPRARRRDGRATRGHAHHRGGHGTPRAGGQCGPVRAVARAARAAGAACGADRPRAAARCGRGASANYQVLATARDRPCEAA